MNFRNRLQYTSTAALLGLCRVLPQGAIYALFKGIGHIMFQLSANRRKLAIRNIQIVFPEKSPAERRQLAKKSFLSLMESMAFNAQIMCGRITNEQMLDYVEVDDWDSFEAAIEHTPNGIMAISGHLGNWELAVQYISYRSPRPTSAIARKTNNPLMEERIILPLRERFGTNIIYKKKALIKLVKALKKGHMIGMLIDQRLNRNQGITIDFFGREAGCTAAPAILQLRFDCTTVPLFMVHTGHHKYRLVICDPIVWTDNGKSQEEQVFELTQLHQQAIADAILQYPEQWFWLHNRWGLNKDEL